MKALKSVFSAFAALFLAVSLTGCLGDEKTASQSGSSESSVFDSGKVKLVVKPGVRFVYMHFSDRASAEQQHEAIGRAFENSGAIGYKSKISGNGGEVLLFVSVDRVEKEFFVNIDSGSLIDIDIQSSNGQVAIWTPSTGSEVKYLVG